MKLVLIVLFAIFASVSQAYDIVGYWENDKFAAVVSDREIVLYGTNFSESSEQWFGGTFYHSPRIDAMCVDLIRGNSLYPTVSQISHVPSGTLCLDVIDGVLISGFHVFDKNFLGCPVDSFHWLIFRKECSGVMDFQQR